MTVSLDKVDNVHASRAELYLEKRNDCYQDGHHLLHLRMGYRPRML